MNNVPMIVQQIRENMLDPKSTDNIRNNYKMTMENVRDFCDRSLLEYNRFQTKKGKK